MSVDDTERIRFGARLRHAGEAAVLLRWRVLGDGARSLWVLAPAPPDPQRGVR